MNKFLILLLAVFTQSITFLHGQDFSIDQNRSSQSEKLQTVYKLHQFDTSLLNKGAVVTYVDPDLSEYILVPEKAGQGWTLGLFDFSKKTAAHYHKLQNQLVMLLEGQLTVRIENQEVTLLPGQYALIPKEAVHALAAGNEGSRFVVLDLPGYDYPTDRLEDRSLPKLEKTIEATETSSPFFVDQSINITNDEKEKFAKASSLPLEYGKREDLEGCILYEIVSRKATNHRWEIVFSEIKDPNAVKYVEVNKKGFNERIIVLSGEILVEVDGKEHRLTVGQSIRIASDQFYKVSFCGLEPVRMLFVTVI